MDQSKRDGSSRRSNSDVTDKQAEDCVEVLLFAGAAEIAHSQTVKLLIQLPTDIQTLVEKLRSDYPKLAPYTLRSRFAVNQSFVGPSFIIHSNADEIAMIPPVSGG